MLRPAKNGWRFNGKIGSDADPVTIPAINQANVPRNENNIPANIGPELNLRGLKLQMIGISNPGMNNVPSVYQIFTTEGIKRMTKADNTIAKMKPIRVLRLIGLSGLMRHIRSRPKVMAESSEMESSVDMIVANNDTKNNPRQKSVKTISPNRGKAISGLMSCNNARA